LFTGIIECTGVITQLENDRGNLNIMITSTISDELKVDQSLAHNGVCLTVVKLEKGKHSVTAIAETLQKTNLGKLQVGDLINLERCMQMNGRLDGHIVQGHVDQTGICTEVSEMNGSWVYKIAYDSSLGNVTVEKGSVCLNGISLTVVDSLHDSFSVHIIPYTYENTNLKFVRPGDSLNLEFDIIGKYVSRIMKG
jgi:riboflavin synthase